MHEWCREAEKTALKIAESKDIQMDVHSGWSQWEYKEEETTNWLPIGSLKSKFTKRTK